MKRLLLFVVALVLGATSAVQAQINPQQPIPADKEIRQGVLPNGLTYYIRHNEKPKGMANFYIVHDVGAAQEGDNQQGLAHFLEHMAFNGTKNYPEKTMIEYLESIGVKFGANLNAFTSWDLTQYFMTDVPVARESVIDSTLMILHDWSHFISLEEEEIDNERGVIKEELRTRDGASWRSTIEMLKAVGKGTIYAERNLIGYLDGLQSFTYQDIRDFYHKWYRPDYQAVVVVGDIDVDAVENKIKTIMADIPAAAADAAQKEVVVVPGNDEPIVSIFTDPEQQRSMMQVIYKSQAMPKQYKGLVMAELVDIMTAYISTMMNERLTDISRKPNAPFTMASFSAASSFGICPTLDVNVGGVMTPDGKLKEGYAALLTEMERMRRYGFTQGEFERAQQNLLSSIETQYNSRDDREHDFFAERCIDNFRLGTPIPDAETERNLDKQLTEMINVDMINATVKQLYDPLKNVVIIVQSPEKEGVAVPTEQEVVDMLKAAVAAEVAPFEDNTVKEPLIGEDVVLKGSPVKKQSVNSSLGTTEWTLKNGIKVVVKQTPYEADNISFNAFSDGGAAIFDNEHYYSAQMLGSVMSMSGISKFSASDLRKQLSGKQAEIYLGASQYSHTVSGSAMLKDAETMFQLLYLAFTAPRFSEDDFNVLMNRYNTMLANQMTNPDMIFSMERMKTCYGDNFRRQQISPELLQNVKFEHMAPIHAKLYANAADFHFEFVGNMSPEELKPLVEKYIGSLPVNKKAANSFVDDGVRMVKGDVVNDFRVKMEQPKVKVSFMYSGDLQYNSKNKLIMEFFTSALDNRYLKSIREEKGGTYGVGVRGTIDAEPVEKYDLLVAFDTNEQMADELAAIVVAEIEKIAAEGPLAEDMAKTREFLMKDIKKKMEQNYWWVSTIHQYYKYGINNVEEYEAAVEAVTSEDVQALAKKVLADGNLIKVIMRPEKAE